MKTNRTEKTETIARWIAEALMQTGVIITMTSVASKEVL